MRSPTANGQVADYRRRPSGDLLLEEQTDVFILRKLKPRIPNRAVYQLVNGKGGNAAPVGSHPGDVSPFGVLDMAGNVLEWCSDWAAQYEDGFG